MDKGGEGTRAQRTVGFAHEIPDHGGKGPGWTGWPSPTRRASWAPGGGVPLSSGQRCNDAISFPLRVSPFCSKRGLFSAEGSVLPCVCPSFLEAPETKEGPARPRGRVRVQVWATAGQGQVEGGPALSPMSGPAWAIPASTRPETDLHPICTRYAGNFWALGRLEKG